MSDRELRDMWSQAENLGGSSGYGSSTIERLLGNRSRSVGEKVKGMLKVDMAVKALVGILLAIDAVLYYQVQMRVSLTCLCGLALLVPLVLFEFRVLKQFTKVADYGQNTKERLSRMLTFLRSRFFTALLSTSSTYLFVFLSGSLLYFFLTYGQLRPLDNMDVFVFSTLCLIGVAMNFGVYGGQIKYNIRHLEACLSDLDDQALAVVTSNLETQRKMDHTIKILLGLVIVLGFVVLIAVLKAVGV